jgi:hypothetical protein
MRAVEGQEIVNDWGAPISGQIIVDYDDRWFPVFKRRATVTPVIFKQREACRSSPNAQNISQKDHLLRITRALIADPAAFCPWNWQSSDRQRFEGTLRT